MRILIITILSLGLLSPLTAGATTFTHFSAEMNGQQANGGLGSGSLATGTAELTLNHDTNEISWNVSWEGLNSPAIAAHFHGPALPGMDAFVEVIFDYTSNPSIGSRLLTDLQVSNVLAGLWYVNIHTDFFLSGEIRGQILPVATVPIPAAFWMLLTGVAGLLGTRRSSRA